MKSILETTEALVGIVSYILVLGVVCQSAPYRLRERPDCEPHCKTIQHFNGSCPTYGSCLWYCQENQANCKQNTRYHCARDLHNNESFIDACAAEIFCLAGEEPHISRQDIGKASVYCRPCYQQLRYNSDHNTSSATFSECPRMKTNLCSKSDHKIDCENVPERTKTDGYCRCDSRNGYAAQSQEMCFYENIICVKTKCPDGKELLLNYTCSDVCREGFERRITNDTCVLKTHSSSVPTVSDTSITKTVSKTIPTTSTGKQDVPPTIEVHDQILLKIALPLIIIGVTLITVIYLIYVYRERISRSCKKTDKHTSAEEREMATLISQQESHESKSDPPMYLGWELCEAVYKYITNHQRFQWNECLKLIDGGPIFPFEKLKYIEIKQPETDKFRFRTIPFDTSTEFKVYEKPDGEDMCLYEWISNLVYGSDSFKGIIRLAAVRYALSKFETYVKELTEVFSASAHDGDARIFFEAHGVPFEENKTVDLESRVSRAFAKLVCECVSIGKGSGPFYVEFLRGALNCKITQNFENNCFNDINVNTIKALGVSIETITSRHRPLHIYWEKINSGCFHLCPVHSVLQNLQNKTEILAQVHPSKNQGDCDPQPEREESQSDIQACDNVYTYLRFLKYLNTSHMTECMNIIANTFRYNFENLKNIHITQLDSAHFRRVQQSNYPEGAYVPNGDAAKNMYGMFSLLIHSASFKNILRLAAMQYALNNFYELAKGLEKPEDSNHTAKYVLKKKGILWKPGYSPESVSASQQVSLTCVDLVKEIVTQEKGEGPFHVEMLGGALGITIDQYIDEEGRIEPMRPFLRVPKTSTEQGRRQLQIFWTNSSSGCLKIYCIVPCFGIETAV